MDYSPVVHSYAIVTLDSAFFYVDKRKVTAEVSFLRLSNSTVHAHDFVGYGVISLLCVSSILQVQKYMVENGIDIREYETVQSDVSLLASGNLKSSVHGEKDINVVEGSKIWIDSASCCLALYSKLNPHQVLILQSPIALPKAVKVNLLYYLLC